MRIMPIALTILLAGFLCACNPGAEEPSPRPPVENPGNKPGGDTTDPEDPPQTTHKMKITIGSTIFTATLTDNATTTALRAMLPMSISMSEMNGNEKYYNLPGSLPVAPSSPGVVRSGDIMLFGSNCLVLFYKMFSTPYSYTRIGSVDDPSGLERALGSGEVTVKFESEHE